MPAQAGLRRQWLLQDRPRIDVRFLVAAEGAHHATQFLQPAEHHVVVIGPEGIFRNAVGRGRMGLIIIQPDHDDTPGLREYARGVGPAVRVLCQPVHVAVHTVGNPLAKIIGANIRVHWRNAEHIEPHR